MGEYGRGASATTRTACSFAEEMLTSFGEVSRKIAARYRMMASTGTTDQAAPDRHAGALFWRFAAGAPRHRRHRPSSVGGS
jgi:hypothetical protein